MVGLDLAAVVEDDGTNGIADTWSQRLHRRAGDDRDPVLTVVVEFIEQANASAEVVPLLEEPEAFANLDELLDVDGLRAVALGPPDLAIRLGGAEDAGAQERVAELLGQLLDAATPRGISVIDGA